MLSEKRTVMLRDSLASEINKVIDEGAKKGFDPADIEKINEPKLTRLRHQIEILNVVITYNK